jgi:mono/diheme cytochrome c family protein
VNGRDTTLIQIVLHGVQGPLTVNGTSFSGAMPAFGTQLSDAEIAALLTYVRSQWGNAGAAVSVAQVAAQRAATATRSGAWNGDAELTKLP